MSSITSWADETDRMEQLEYEEGVQHTHTNQLLCMLILVVDTYSRPNHYQFNRCVTSHISNSSFTLHGCMHTIFSNLCKEL